MKITAGHGFESHRAHYLNYDLILFVLRLALFFFSFLTLLDVDNIRSSDELRAEKADTLGLF
jgi:hypothetical protein